MWKALTANWKTSLTAVLLALGAIGSATLAMIDSDPLTVPDWNKVVVVLIAAAGLLFARDADKSSQDSGIRY